MKYYQTYIRIDTPSYYNNNVYGGVGFANNEQRQQYKDEVNKLIKKMGYKLEDKSDSFYYYGKNKEIYFHPQSISGIFEEKELNRLLQNIDNDIFKVETKQDGSLWIDKYDEYLDIYIEEYNNLILEKKEQIKARMLELFKTNRYYQYKNLGNVENILFDEFQIKTLENYKDSLYMLISICLKELKEQGLIIQWENDNLYRTANKSELKRKKVA